MKNDVHHRNAAELVTMLRNKEISSIELLDATIARIERFDKKINAVIVKDFERAYQAAKIADAAISHGKQLPLLGLPITVKESFNVEGLTTTWGNAAYKTWRPNDEALAVTRLKEAGAIIIGKTNVPFMLSDWQSYNDIYGTTNNPWNLSLTPGGSSGGSAAALASGFIALELGSDLAGSLRVPAHYCGVYAHKPSQDLISMRGVAPPTMSAMNNRIDLAVAGPMARTANDLALALNILAEPDEALEGKGYKLALPFSRHENLNNFRVLIINEHPLCPTASNIHKSINDLAEHLIKLGVKVSHHAPNMPDIAKITQNYAFLLGAFFAGDMPIAEYERTRASVNNLDANDVSLTSYLLRGLVSSHREWFIETRMRAQLRQQWRQLFKEFDIVICPSMHTPAFPHDHSNPHTRQIEIDGAQVAYGDQFAWSSIATLFGLPATAVPIDRSANGLPIGVQIIGDYLEDHTTIKFAELLEQEFGRFSMPDLEKLI